MAVGSIKFGGLASGIDTSAIIEALMDVERLPVKRMEDDRADVVQRQSLIRDLNTMMLELRESARAIDNRSDSLTARSSKEELLATVAESSNETVLTATSTGSAAPGTYSVRVEQLATAARRVSAAYDSAADPVGQGGDTLSIAYGGTATIDLALDGTESLSDVADLINENANNDGSVRASILDDGQGGFRLIIAGTDVGTDDDVIVTTSLPGPLGLPFIDDARSQSATDAQLVVFGTTITRKTNEVSDVIPGVTLKLTATNDPAILTDAVSVTVSRDGEAIAEKLQKLVDAYNKVREFGLRQSTYDTVNKKAGLLSGDIGLRLAEKAAQDVIARSFSFAGNPYTSLSSIGIEFEVGGKLSLDRTVLDAAVATDPDSVRELLSGDGTVDGAATALARSLEPIVRSGDGVLAERLDAIDDEIDGIDDRIARYELRLDAIEESLTRRFSALEQLIADFQSSSSFLDRITAANTKSR